MIDSERESDPILDAEYRELVRLLHKDTIAAVSLVDDWWNHQAYMATISGMNGRADAAEVDRVDRQWREEIRPALLRLLNGHPDPAVRDAADFFNTRLVGAMVLMHRRPGDPEMPDKEHVDNKTLDTFTIHLVHDGLTKLRRAAYHAPFRVHRPEPEWEGVPIGNSEGLPEDIMGRIEERGEHYEG